MSTTYSSKSRSQNNSTPFSLLSSSQPKITKQKLPMPRTVRLSIPEMLEEETNDHSKISPILKEPSQNTNSGKILANKTPIIQKYLEKTQERNESLKKNQNKIDISIKSHPKIDPTEKKNSLLEEYQSLYLNELNKVKSQNIEDDHKRKFSSTEKWKPDRSESRKKNNLIDENINYHKNLRELMEERLRKNEFSDNISYNIIKNDNRNNLEQKFQIISNQKTDFSDPKKNISPIQQNSQKLDKNRNQFLINNENFLSPNHDYPKNLEQKFQLISNQTGPRKNKSPNEIQKYEQLQRNNENIIEKIKNLNIKTPNMNKNNIENLKFLHDLAYNFKNPEEKKNFTGSNTSEMQKLADQFEKINLLQEISESFRKNSQSYKEKIPKKIFSDQLIGNFIAVEPKKQRKNESPKEQIFSIDPKKIFSDIQSKTMRNDSKDRNQKNESEKLSINEILSNNFIKDGYQKKKSQSIHCNVSDNKSAFSKTQFLKIFGKDNEMKDIKTNEKIENIVYEDKKNEFPISFINLNNFKINSPVNNMSEFDTSGIHKYSFDFQYVIGKGGFGKVWKVNLKKNRALYAMKEMSKSKVISKRSVNSVMNERELLSMLKHQFLVNMVSAFQDRETLYLVMDLMTGGDLRYHIGRQRRFSEIQTKFFVACILIGLEYLHDKGIIHRDIKPENLVLDKNGYVRITDLGIARLWKAENSADTSGTPGYMAPEVMCRQNHTIAVDYFALGVIAYEFMLGKRPYLGRSRKEIRDAILSKQEQIKRQDIPENWSLESADFINRLIQRKPGNRLGFNGPKEVKNHSWFKGFPWDKLLKKELNPPFKPNTKGDNFDAKQQLETSETGEENLQQNLILLRRNSVQKLFAGYSYEGNFLIPSPEIKENNPSRSRSSSMAMSKTTLDSVS